MKCPLLRQTEVRSCRAWGHMAIPPGPAAGEEKCSSGAFAECVLYQRQQFAKAYGTCPFLDASLAQFCSGAAVRKLIPYSESPGSTCHNGRFRYCEVYEELAHVEDAIRSADPPIAEWLLYAPNHMWIDVGEDGVWHAGVDALAARVFGEVDAVSFAGIHAAACLNGNGIGWNVAFPGRPRVTGCNLYLRSDPGKVITHPHTLGWLFRGENGAAVRHAPGLRGGEEARRWMREELARWSPPRSREQRLMLCHEFLSLEGGMRGQS